MIIRRSLSQIFLLDEEYARMPPVFNFDRYEICVNQKDGIYCTTNIDLVTDEENELYNMIQVSNKIYLSMIIKSYLLVLTQNGFLNFPVTMMNSGRALFNIIARIVPPRPVEYHDHTEDRRQVEAIPRFI
ncbi:hypothetical protein RR46_07876 [Papilio xuthus]|uniref:Uncharacterized protein n=1 Tax=Papilio xuthus TaxID=66420 RepID=A0A194QF59_PAPXU|nr:hypothetical protein RR46_07876 [Papilio xuthus]